MPPAVDPAQYLKDAAHCRRDVRTAVPHGPRAIAAIAHREHPRAAEAKEHDHEKGPSGRVCPTAVTKARKNAVDQRDRAKGIIGVAPRARSRLAPIIRAHEATNDDEAAKNILILQPSEN